MAVNVNTSGVFQAGLPKVLFKVSAGELFSDVSSYGKRFLTANAQRFTAVLNWTHLLKR
jgi:hypothetical protein